VPAHRAKDGVLEHYWKRRAKMLYLTLRYSQHALTNIPRFKRFLATSQLSIIGEETDPQQQIIKLTVNARIYGAAKWAARLAADCFDHDLLEVAGIETATTL
jgi:hypothetical protein